MSESESYWVLMVVLGLMIVLVLSSDRLAETMSRRDRQEGDR